VRPAGVTATGRYPLLDAPVPVPVRCPADWLPCRPALDLDAHTERFGPAPAGGGTDLVGTLDRIGLSGRGGGHFPVAAKWRAVHRAAGPGRTPVLVANAAEGEPASAKDRVLLLRHPHLVLDGLFAAAATLRAGDLVVWLHDGEVAARVALTRALTQRHAAGLREPPVRLVTGATGYTGGESSAVVDALSGGPGRPGFAPVPSAQRGVHGRPTLVQNVETLARVALAARTGAERWVDTVLLTVLGDGVRTVLELPATATLAQAVAAGWVSDQPGPRAVLLGGYGGSWLPWTQAAGLVLAEPALRAAGTSLGAGVLVPLPAGACALAEVAAVAGYLAGSGAGQCGPCRFGLPAIAAVLADLAAGRAGRGDLRRLARYVGEVDGRGACHLPDGVARFVASGLRAFPAEAAAHRRGRPCPGGAYQRLLPVPGRD